MNECGGRTLSWSDVGGTTSLPVPFLLGLLGVGTQVPERSSGLGLCVTLVHDVAHLLGLHFLISEHHEE